MRHAFPILIAVVLLQVLCAAAGAQDTYGPRALIEDARREGKLTLYTATAAEGEQLWAAAFNQRFPAVKVQIVRAPGGQLVTRIRSEAAAGKLGADVIHYTDRAEIAAMEDMFQPYAPPNAADFPPSLVIVPGKIWPTGVNSHCIMYNTALVATPPTSWMDLLKPEYKGGRIGETIAGSGGANWLRTAFQRKMFGESYWARLAANEPTLYPSTAPLSDAIVRGEVWMGAVGLNNVVPKIRDGAPVACAYPVEGMPIFVYAAGIPTTAPNPNAAKLYLNWCLSPEGQDARVKELGMLSPLPAVAKPNGVATGTPKFWEPAMSDFALREAWTADWNKVFGYRQ